MVPMALGQQQEWGAVVAIGLDQGQGFRFNRLAQFAALAVEGLAVLGSFQSQFLIFCGEQFHHQAGIAKPTHGIDAWGNLKAHGLGIEAALPQAGQLAQGLQARQGTMGQLG